MQFCKLYFQGKHNNPIPLIRQNLRNNVNTVQKYTDDQNLRYSAINPGVIFIFRFRMVTRTNFNGDQFPENNRAYYFERKRSKEQGILIKISRGKSFFPRPTFLLNIADGAT